MGSLIQAGGGKEGRRRFRLPRTRHEAIGPAMLACILGVAAGIAMLAYGNFGHASTAEAAGGPQRLQIVAAPLESSSPIPTGLDKVANRIPTASADPAPIETAQASGPAPDITATSTPTPAADSEMAQDAASAGMTSHVQSGLPSLS